MQAAQTEEAGTTDLAGLIQNLQTDGSGAEAALPKFAKGDKIIVIEGELGLSHGDFLPPA